MNYVTNVAISIDKLLNALLWGGHAETLSARAYRMSGKKKRWMVARSVINCLFFWDENHCKASYEAAISRKREYLQRAKAKGLV